MQEPRIFLLLRDQPTDQQTNGNSYRCAGTHIKRYVSGTLHDIGHYSVLEVTLLRKRNWEKEKKSSRKKNPLSGLMPAKGFFTLHESRKDFESHFRIGVPHSRFPKWAPNYPIFAFGLKCENGSTRPWTRSLGDSFIESLRRRERGQLNEIICASRATQRGACGCWVKLD